MSQPCARALLDHALKQTGSGQNMPVTVDTLQGILRVEHKLTVKRRELTRTLRALAQAGSGQFVTGRQGNPSRFIWSARTTLAAAILPDKSTNATDVTNAANAANAAHATDAAHPAQAASPTQLKQRRPSDKGTR